VTRDEFAQSIAANQSSLLERIWEPKVLVRSRIPANSCSPPAAA
jgi:hypothetical protein